MQNSSQKKPVVYWVFLVLCWSIALSSVFTYVSFAGLPPRPPSTFLEGTFLWVGLLFFVLPFTKAVCLGPFSLELLDDGSPSAGEVVEAENKEQEAVAARPAVRRTSTEYKILRTLWARQVNKFPDLRKRFSLRVDFPIGQRLAEYSAAVAALEREGRIRVRPDEYVYLTDEGLRYCSKYYDEFGTAMWFGEQELDGKSLKEALEATKKL